MMRSIECFHRCSQGSAAMEFAVAAPIFIALLLGSVEYGRALSIDRRLVATTHTVADLTGQYTQMSLTDDATVLNVSSEVMAPYDTTPLTIVLSELSTDANGRTTVTWSKALHTTALVPGTLVVLPTGATVSGQSVIYSQTTYTYNPLVAGNFVSPLTFSSQIIMAPRLSATVDQTGS